MISMKTASSPSAPVLGGGAGGPARAISGVKLLKGAGDTVGVAVRVADGSPCGPWSRAMPVAPAVCPCVLNPLAIVLCDVLVLKKKKKKTKKAVSYSLRWLIIF